MTVTELEEILMKTESPCGVCGRERTCKTPCKLFRMWFRTSWTAVRSVYGVLKKENALDSDSLNECL